MKSSLKYMTILLNSKVVKRPRVKDISDMQRKIGAAAKTYGHTIKALVKDADGKLFMNLSYKEDKGGVFYLVNNI